MQGDRYSNMVAWLKVALPLAALGLLSTLFLLARVVDPVNSIPFADTEVQERLLNQKVSGPYYTGTTSDGDQIAFIAETVTSPNGVTGATEANDVYVKVDMVNGTRLIVTALKGKVDVANDTSNLTGSVVMTTSQGYRITSEALFARISALDVSSPGTVLATTPGGELIAGSMHLRSPEADAPAQLFFTNGVKLIYQPKQVKD